MERKGTFVNEDEQYPIQLNGGSVNWLMTPEKNGTEHSSVCIFTINPGSRVLPAHAHPEGEETIYVISGIGKVKIGNEIKDIRPGSIFNLHPQVPHLIYNTGNYEMKTICFFPTPEAVPNTPQEGYDF